MKLNLKTIIAVVVALLAIAFPSLRGVLLDSEEEILSEKVETVETLSSINNGDYPQIKDSKLYPALVTDVADGDTIHVTFTDEIPLGCYKNSKVRFVGVNTPEMNAGTTGIPDFYAKEATEFTTKNLLNENIYLEFDDVSEKKDTYDRLLCYIWLDDVLYNQVLIEQGYGRYFDKYAFNSERMKIFSKASKTAKEKKAGMWQ